MAVAMICLDDQRPNTIVSRGCPHSGRQDLPLRLLKADLAEYFGRRKVWQEPGAFKERAESSEWYNAPVLSRLPLT